MIRNQIEWIKKRITYWKYKAKIAHNQENLLIAQAEVAAYQSWLYQLKTGENSMSYLIEWLKKRITECEQDVVNAQTAEDKRNANRELENYNKWLISERKVVK